MLRKIISAEVAKRINPVSLAFIGDAVYTLRARFKNVLSGDYKSGELNERTSREVCAVAQAAKIDLIMPILTDDERDVFRRARNAHKPSHAKHSTVSEYNKSTGLEALVGYLYLTGDDERLEYLLNYNQEADDES